MKIVKFVNFTDEPFTGKWDSRSKTVAPGQTLYMADYLAYHFAKHLVNRELTKLGLYAETSPKKPEDAPHFVELWNKAIFYDEHEDDMGGMDIMDIKPQNRHVEEDPKQAAKRGAGSMTIKVEDPDFVDADKADKADEAAASAATTDAPKVETK